MTIKIYIAAPYAARDHLATMVEWLAQHDIVVTSRWLDATHEIGEGTINAAPALDDEYAMRHSIEDFEDVCKAEAVLHITGDWAAYRWVLNKQDTTSGGRHIEVGYALGQGIPVISLGAPENIFHRGVCRVVTTLADAVVALQDIELPTR